MKVMIVDDEILVRAGMRMVIDWHSLGFEIVAEASNAQEGIRIAQEVKPDIMLVDITMPQMNGLEMIGILKEHLPECQFIILSCHSEVEYLTSAIRLQVADYLIKDSLNPQEITATLNKLKERWSIGKTSQGVPPANLRNWEQRFIEAKASPHLTCSHLGQQLGWPAVDSQFFALRIMLQRHSDLYTAERLCDELIREYTLYAAYYHTKNSLVFFAQAKQDSHPQKIISHRCVETLSQSFTIQAAAGASQTCDGDTPYMLLYRQASSAVRMCYLFGWKNTYLYNKEQLENSRTRILNLRNTLSDVTSIYQIDLLEHYLQQLDDIIRSGGYIRYSLVIHLYTDFAFLLNELLQKEPEMAFFLFPIEAMPVEKEETYNALHSRFTDKLASIRAYLEEHQGAGISREIKQYIAANLEGRILLEDIAEEIHLSRTYISSLFKKETGQNINSYITQQKLSYAKDLLLRGESIAEVTHRIGVQTESYFSKLFKEQYGSSPSKYIRIHKYDG